MTERGQAPDDLRRFCEFGGMAGPVAEIVKGEPMREKPILFSGEMVRAILAGRKTQTRRIVKGSEDCEGMDAVFDRLGVFYRGWWSSDGATQTVDFIPKVGVGSQLWVRETHHISHTNAVMYRADYFDCDPFSADDCGEDCSMVGERWRPSIHMPRWASRITLKVTGVRVERLQDISEADSQAEGIRSYEFIPDDGFPYCIGWTHLQKDDGKSVLHTTAKSAFEVLWRKINGPESWDENPWVWVYEFERHKGDNQ